jgi:hypothetical protein
MNPNKFVAVLLAIAVVGTGGAAAVGAGPSLTPASNAQLAEDADDDGTTNRTALEGDEMEREVRHPDARDDNDSFPVAQSAALETARSALSNHAWALVESSVHEESGYYEFEFTFDGNGSGEAEVRVDGSTGEVFRLEEEIEQDEDDDETETETPEPTETEDEDEDETETPEPTETEDEDETETETPEPTETEDEDEDETETPEPTETEDEDETETRTTISGLR